MRSSNARSEKDGTSPFASRRTVAHVPRVHLVHRGEVVEILEKDARLDEVRERAPRLFEDRRQVAKYLIGLRRDVTLDRRRSRLEPQLPRNEHEITCADRLVVWGSLEWCRSVLGPNHDLLHDVSSSLYELDASASATPSDLKIASST